jgi:spermidine/putrescine transport system permease protein
MGGRKRQPALSSILRLSGTRRQQAVWAAFAAPGAIWLILLFLVPFYAVLAIAGGHMDYLIQNPTPAWNPATWTSASYVGAWHLLVGANSYIGPPLVRTIEYVAAASAMSLALAYPVAYFVTRHAGKFKGIYLVLLISPFWISYMMRMLAWIDLLSTGGYVNKIMTTLHIIGQPVNWLGGDPITVIFGLVYGYIPYMVLVLVAGLDRIDKSFLEASRDLGLGRVRTFLKVTAPMSRQTVLAALLITVLPMVGDFFTNQMLSSSPNTTMIGNVIDSGLSAPFQEGTGAVLVLMLLCVLIVPMILYVRRTAKALAEEAY